MTKEEVKQLITRLSAYEALTGIKLDAGCHFDREYVNLWYEKKYITGVQQKWAMQKGSSITHYGDGVIYTSRNMTDEIAERLMKENEGYKTVFVEIKQKF